MKQILLVLFCAAGASAAITGARLIGVTNTQAIIGYTAPDASACTVEVSEESDYTPLVHDVNGTLFSGADSDARATSVNRGRERVVVIGKRTIETGADSLNYSRALQAATLHYYRITCGSDTVAGTFTTATLPLGVTRTDGYIPDETYLGEPKEISFDMTTRNATVIDPHTGVQARLLQLPGDHTETSFSSSPRPLSVVSSTDWTNASNFVGTTPATYATFDGASCAPTCNGIIVEATTGIGFSYQHANGTDWYKVSLTGYGSSATAADRTVNVCLVPNAEVYFQAYPPASGAAYTRGTVCDTHAGAVVKQIVLPQSSESTVSVQDSFRVPGHTLHLHGFQVAVSDVAKPRFMVWKANGNGTLSVRNATFGWRGSNVANVGSAGEFKRCSNVMRSDGTYLCMTAKETGSIYSVNGTSGEVRFLGVIKYITGLGVQYCNLDHVPWSDTDANTWLCTQTANPAIIGKFTYSGDGTNKAQDYVLTVNTDFTVEWIISDLKGILNTFYAAHESEYYTMLGGAGNFNRFNVGPFTSCSIVNIQKANNKDHGVGYCRSTDADTPGWAFAIDMTNNTVVALTPMYATASARWCTAHYMDVITQPVISIFGQKSGYKAQLVDAIDSDDTTITLTSSCTGDCDGFHDGDPVAIGGTAMAAEFLMPIQVGDRLVLTGTPYTTMDSGVTEYVRVTGKPSANTYTIQRGQQGVGAKSHLAGAAVHPTCSSWPNSTGSAFEMYYYSSVDGRDHSGQWTWDFIADPYGQSLDGTGVWNFQYYGHTSSEFNVFSNGNRVTTTAEGTYVMPTAKAMDTTWYQWEPLGFGGKNGIGTGNAYQSHVSLMGKNGAGLMAHSMWNAHPLVGGVFTATPASCDIDAAPIDTNPTTGCPLGRISGTSNTYRYVHVTTPYTFSPKHFYTFGAAGHKVLHDISSAATGNVISDATPYSFCVAVAANECRTGSSAGQIFVSVPDSIGKAYCSGGESFSGQLDVCIGNVEWKSSGSTQMVHGINSKTGLYSVAAGYETIANGAGGIRLLARHALSGGYRRMPGFSSTKPLANARYALADWAHVSEGTRMVVLRVPPLQQDSINRAMWYPVKVVIPAGSLPADTNNVVAEFGYTENGTTSQLYCNTRREACVAHRSSINEANPYSYATSESSTVGDGLACESGCTLVIPAFPGGRVLYYRVKYRDVSNNVILTGPLQVAVIP